MLPSWLPKALFPIVFALVFALFRRMAPPPSKNAHQQYDESQAPEPLPAGVIGGAMCGLGMGFALLFFVLRGANHWWASLDRPAILTQYAPAVIWCVFPGFAALAVPWPLTVWYLRKVGRWEEADRIQNEADAQLGMSTTLIMKWLSMGIVGPIGVFTVLAIPIHLSISGSEVRVGHYASFHSQIFDLNQARRLTVVDGYRLRDGSFHPAKDVYIDFAGGRRLRGNQAGDGGTSVRSDVMQLLIEKTGLTPHHVETEEEIPILPAER